jgi:hypothetical protein
MQIRILLVVIACIILTYHNYLYTCNYDYSDDFINKDINLFECFNFPIDLKAVKSTLIAILLNSTLFVGPFY